MKFTVDVALYAVQALAILAAIGTLAALAVGPILRRRREQDTRPADINDQRGEQ